LNYEVRGIGPSGRSMHTATAIDRKMYVFGGANSTGTRDDTSGFCDLYQLDLDTMTWAECQTKGTPPSPCYGHSATDIGGNRILFFGGKGYAVTNDIHILHLNNMEWKKYAFAGNQLVPRWGHSGTFHENRVLLYGGRDGGGYWSTFDNIDIDKELIELPPEESAADILKREAEDVKRKREIIGGLQSEMEELKVVITRIGEELINQKKEKEEIMKAISSMDQENNGLRQRIQDYLMAQNPNAFRKPQPQATPQYGGPNSSYNSGPSGPGGPAYAPPGSNTPAPYGGPQPGAATPYGGPGGAGNAPYGGPGGSAPYNAPPVASAPGSNNPAPYGGPGGPGGPGGAPYAPPGSNTPAPYGGPGANTQPRASPAPYAPGGGNTHTPSGSAPYNPQPGTGAPYGGPGGAPYSGPSGTGSTPYGGPGGANTHTPSGSAPYNPQPGTGAPYGGPGGAPYNGPANSAPYTGPSGGAAYGGPAHGTPQPYGTTQYR